MVLDALYVDAKQQHPAASLCPTTVQGACRPSQVTDV